MSKVTHWVVLNADGSINCQPNISGNQKPSEAGDNPDGLREFKVSRHGDPTHEHFDAEKLRWVSDGDLRKKHERRARLAAMHRDELVDHIVEEVVARLKAGGA